MLQQEIRLTVLNTGNELVHFQIELTNGITSVLIDFYGYSNEFKNFANGLISFPKTIDDTVKYELGNVGERWAYYILLNVYCYDNNGHSAIHVIVDNNRKQPYTNKGEFYITTLPASLNKLGQLLIDWNPKTTKEVKWMAE